jgi:hypothetical protein
MKLEVQKKVEISHNMEDLLIEIKNTLQKYDVVINEDTLKDTKILMASINKDKQEFADACKIYLLEIEAPIKAFKIKKKEIEDLFIDARLRLSSQVDKYEVIKLDEISDTIINTKNNMCNEKGIDTSKVSVEELIKLSAVTTTGKASKATITIIENKILIVEAEIAKQEAATKEKMMRDEQIRIDAIQKERERVEKNRLDNIELVEQKVKQDLAEVLTESQGVKKPITPPVQEETINENGKKVFKVLIEFSVTAPSHLLHNSVCNTVYKGLMDLGLKKIKIYN